MHPDIVFANQDFVVANKPAGVLTVPSHQGRADPRPVLGIQLQDHLARQIFPVHRLDVDVSGLVLYALNAQAHRAANGWFEQQRVRKTYRAWTQTQGFDHLPAAAHNPRLAIALQAQQHFEWHGRIARNKRRAFPSPHGNPSLTHAVFLEQDYATGYLHWDLQPLTGRPHQLRVDLSRHGFPIIGDRLYGATRPWHEAGIALRAWRLDFQQIATAERFGLDASIELPGGP
ncbi:MAG: RNA pseudouridine synthase [Gammaproteobacteria bacterium]|nr:RNA pseudouridine synthase [Gammaproteobacteria bacterium]